MKQQSQRSPRNKTLVLTDEDRKILIPKIFKPTVCIQKEQIGGKVINADIFDVLPLLPKSFINLLIVDPPYNLSKNYHGKKFQESSEEQYFQYLESWFVNLLPCLAEDASIYICCDWKSSNAVYSLLNKYTIVQNRITWQREKGRGARTNWKNGMEDIWFATVSKNYYFDIEAVKIKRKVIAPYTKDGIPKDWEKTPQGNFRLTHPSNFWNDISIPYWSMYENTEHPTQKPEKLIAKLILASSREGDFVFDPFLGSGTTAVVAEKLNRVYAGVEQNLEYCLWAEKRLSEARNNNCIQGYDGVFWERNSNPHKI